MNRKTCRMLAVLFLLTILLNTFLPSSLAAGSKQVQPRTIAIVFDNSGSMYSESGVKQDRWCRATYAMEVFASMLNEGDELFIYPMHSFLIGDTQYEMEKPLRITGPDNAGMIREIYTLDAYGTPIESIDVAYQGLKNAKGEKWLIVLTDGSSFNGDLRGKITKDALNERLGDASKDVNVLYLGIGKEAVVPDPVSLGHTLEIEKAESSSDILSKLTKMCNLIFGRDTIPKSHFNGTTINVDVSLKKLIVFVQGENVSDVYLTDSSGNNVGKMLSSRKAKYSELGAANKAGQFLVDTSLQGMMVTYTDCPIGNLTIHYQGTATSIEAYYEPDVDLVFTFTDEDGREVQADRLYEGNYNISYGMKDAVTGEFTESDLLGNTRYYGSYTINGTEQAIESNEKSGIVQVPLNQDDTFNCRMSVTYLSGYEISVEGSEFGLPTKVTAKPAGELELRISGGQTEYELINLEEGEPFCAEVYYQGQKLTGEELEKVILRWDPEKSGAELKKDQKGDHYDIVLLYWDKDDPSATPTGTFTVPIEAEYTAKGTEKAVSYPVELSYSITDTRSPLSITLKAKQTYYVISELKDGEPIKAEINGETGKLSVEEFNNLKFSCEADGLDIRAEPVPDESAFLLYIEDSGTPDAGIYKIFCHATLPDKLGREASASAEETVELATIPIWLKWAICLLGVLLLIGIISAILHIKALPTKLNTLKRDSSLNIDGEDETKNATFSGELKKKRLDVHSKFAGKKFGLVMDVKPGKGSYIKTPQAKRSAEVNSASVKKIGNATISEAMIGNVRYVYDEEKRKLERIPKSDKPFTIKNGARVTYSGIMQSNGEAKNYSVVTKLNFKKK